MSTEPTHSQSPPAQPTTTPKPVGGPLSGALGVVVFMALFSAAGYLAYNALRVAPPPEPDPPPAVYLCVETQKPFDHIVQKGERIPVLSPHSKRHTGYPTEQCYWTRDGKRRRSPTYVVLNDYLGKPDQPTLCPDCGRVVMHGLKPPPPDTPLADDAGAKPAAASTTVPAGHP